MAGELGDILSTCGDYYGNADFRAIERLYHAARLKLARIQQKSPSEIDFEAAVGVLLELATRKVTDASILVASNERELFDDRNDDDYINVVERMFGIIRSMMNTPNSVRHLDSLFRFLVGKDPNLQIFTLNYDEVLAKTLRNLDTSFEDGFGPVSDGYAQWDSRLLEGPGVKLFKLHGSVDWLYHGLQASRATGFHNEREAAFLDPRTLVKVSPWNWVRPGIKNTDSLSIAMNLGNHKELLYSASEFTFMFWKLEQALDSCDIVVLCGYSFRDERVNLLIEKALAMRKGSLGVIIVDPWAVDICARIYGAQRLRENSLLAIVSSSAGEAIRKGGFRSAFSSTAKALTDNRWTIDPSIKSDLTWTDMWKMACESIDACVLIQRRIWSKSVPASGAWNLSNDQYVTLVEQCSAIAGRIELVREICELARKSLPDAADLVQPTHQRSDRAPDASYIQDLPAYLSILFTEVNQIHDQVPAVEVESIPWRLANSVASKLADVDGILGRAGASAS